MAYMALGPQVPADPSEKSPARDGRARAAAWLEKNKPSDSTQATALRLFRDVRAGKPPKELEPGIERLLRLQNDGRRLGPGEGPSQRRLCHRASAVFPEPGGGGKRPDGDPASRGVPGRDPEGRRLLAHDLASAPGREAHDQPGAHHLLRERLGDSRPDALGAEVVGPEQETTLRHA